MLFVSCLVMYVCAYSFWTAGPSLASQCPFLTLQGDTPLLVASRNGHRSCVEKLVNGGADLECKDDRVSIVGSINPYTVVRWTFMYF